MPVTFRGAIIDVETSDLFPSRGEVITFGFFSAGEIRIYQKTEQGDDYEFDSIVRSALKLLPRPFFAYNSDFETSWLGVRFELDLMIKWKRLTEDLKGNSNFIKKWPRLSELISIPYEYYRGKVENSGSEIVKLWKMYLKTRDKLNLLRIIYHNKYDLIRECCLLLWDEDTIRLFAEIIEFESENPKTIEEESISKGRQYSDHTK
ncbi:MAG: ribonuclease H-like domain-containing protein [Nitrososphaerales archaeon]|nr:ribonuclease H-like domain-containing protein [Nitrososphaerales archaeon]